MRVSNLNICMMAQTNACCSLFDQHSLLLTASVLRRQLSTTWRHYCSSFLMVALICVSFIYIGWCHLYPLPSLDHWITCLDWMMSYQDTHGCVHYWCAVSCASVLNIYVHAHDLVCLRAVLPSYKGTICSSVMLFCDPLYGINVSFEYLMQYDHQ